MLNSFSIQKEMGNASGMQQFDMYVTCGVAQRIWSKGEVQDGGHFLHVLS
jgi:hypothetical protein